MRINNTPNTGGAERGIGPQQSEEEPEDIKDGL